MGASPSTIRLLIAEASSKSIQFTAIDEIF